MILTQWGEQIDTCLQQQGEQIDSEMQTQYVSNRLLKVEMVSGIHCKTFFSLLWRASSW